MATYGALKPGFTPFGSDEETSDALPTYDSTKTAELSELVSVTATPSISEGKLYANNQLSEYAAEFAEGTIDAEVKDVSPENAALLYGATYDSEGNTLTYRDNDSAPYGCFHFISNIQNDNVKYYEAHFYPKVKAKRGDLSAKTKEGSITFSVPKVSFVWSSPKCGQYELVERFTSLSDADAWISGLISPTA